MPNRTPVTVTPKEIANWRVGQLIDARVTSVTHTNHITFMVSGREIEAQLLIQEHSNSPMPKIQVGDRLGIEVSAQGGEKTLRLIQHEPVQDARQNSASPLKQAVEQLVREALPRQNSAAPLLRNFLYLLRPENEPRPVQTPATAAPANPSAPPPPALSEKEMLEILTRFNSTTFRHSATLSESSSSLSLTGKPESFIPFQLLRREGADLNAIASRTDGTQSSASTPQTPSSLPGEADRLTLLASQISSKPSATVSSPVPEALSGSSLTATPQPAPSPSPAPAEMPRNALPDTLVQTVQQLLQTLPDTSLFLEGNSAARSDAVEKLIRFSGLFMENHLATLPQPAARASLNIDLLALLLKLHEQIKTSLTSRRGNESGNASRLQGEEAESANPVLYDRPSLAGASDQRSVVLPSQSQLQTMVQKWYEQLQAGLRTLQDRQLSAQNTPAQDARSLLPSNPYLRTLPNPFFPDAPPPPLKQFQNQPVPAAKIPSLLQKQLGASEMLDELERQTEAAISRIRLGQTSLTRSENSLQMMVDLPILNGNMVDLFQLRVQSEEQNKENSTGTDRKKQQRWLVELCFELPPMGPVTARIRLEKERVSAQIWASSPEVATMFNNTLDHLKSSLRATGLDVGQIDCISGAPPAPENPPDFDGVINEKA
jgi:hypothetical protein